MRTLFEGINKGVVIAFLAALALTQLAPASLWFEVRSVEVLDSVTDATPVMVIDRIIHRDFSGTYTVDVEKLQPSGRFTVVCSARNSTNYRADAELPDPVTLDWWTWPVNCQIGPGQYRVETRWRIEPDFFPDKQVEFISNVFSVTAL
jgi:hypothetical protein